MALALLTSVPAHLGAPLAAAATKETVGGWLATGVVAHVTLAVLALVVVTGLALTRRIPMVPTFVAALLLTWVPFVGPVLAVTLCVVAARARRRVAEGTPADHPH